MPRKPGKAEKHGPGLAAEPASWRVPPPTIFAYLDAVAHHAELTKEKAGHAVEAVLEHIKKSMKKGDEVRIPDFGTFKVAKRKAREGRNPATGATIKIPAAKVPKFAPSKGLKDLLN